MAETHEAGKGPQFLVPAEYYITPQTVEYLKYQIENEVRRRLVRMLGIPLGGSGLLAILLAVFVYLPNKVEDYINSNPAVEREIQDSTNAYLTNEETGEALVGRGVRAYLGTQIGRQSLADKVGIYLDTNPDVLRSFFESDHGQAVVASVAESTLEGDRFRSLFEQAVDNALQPVLSRLPEQLQQNADDTIRTAGGAVDVRDEDTHAKGFLPELDAFIDRHTNDSEGLLLMELTIGSHIRYSLGACRTYTDQLRNVFGERFAGTLIRDQDSVPVALLAPDAFRGEDQHARGLISEINRADLEAALRHAERLVPASTAIVRDDSSLADALRDELWLRADDGQSVAVVNMDGEFVGVTNRELLLQVATR